MNRKFYLLSIVLAVLIALAMPAYACDVSVTEFDLDLRSDSDGWGNSITAEDEDEVDVRVEVEFGTVEDGSYACETEADVFAEIYKYDSGTQDYEYWVSTEIGNITLQNGEDETFTWNNVFEAENSHESYEIRAYVEDANTEFSSDTGEVEMEEGDCSDISLSTTDYDIDGRETQKRTFQIENNSSTDFDVSTIDIAINQTYLNIEDIDYENEAEAGRDADIDVEIKADETNYRREVDGTLRVSGYLGTTYCSTSDIGSEEFTVEINADGEDDEDESTSEAECEEITIATEDISAKENSKTNTNFYITNDSVKRFEILDIDTSDNGVDIKNKHFEQYAFSGEVADIVLEIQSPYVNKNNVFENYIEVRGMFSDGTECRFGDIDKGRFDVSVKNTAQFSPTECEKFSIDVPEQVTVNNYGSVPFTITNGTGKMADVIFESDLDINPTLVSLPSNTLIERTLGVSMAAEEGKIFVKPRVEGCTYSTQTIFVENEAKGSLGKVTIETKIKEEGGKTIIVAEFSNPTEKVFKGELEANMSEGWGAESMPLTITPGKTIVEIELVPEERAGPLTGTIAFASGGETIEEEIGPQAQNLAAGLFALGTGLGPGMILILVVALAALLVYQIYGGKTEEEKKEVLKWKTQK